MDFPATALTGEITPADAEKLRVSFSVLAKNKEDLDVLAKAPIAELTRNA